MTEIAKGVYAGASQEMIEDLRREFIEDALERVRALDRSLENGADVDAMRRFVFECKGQAHNFNMALLESVAQRFESFLSGVGDSPGAMAPSLHAFLDGLGDILDGTVASDEDPAAVVRGLPAKPAAFDENSIEVRDVEVMLVMLHGAQTHFVEREMQACGYRVTIVTSTFEAIEQVARTKPDMVIISAVMGGLSGVDLAVALSAMPETRNVPVALITSHARDHESLRFLPASVPVISKSGSFGDDLAEALDHHFLL